MAMRQVAWGPKRMPRSEALKLFDMFLRYDGFILRELQDTSKFGRMNSCKSDFDTHQAEVDFVVSHALPKINVKG